MASFRALWTCLCVLLLLSSAVASFVAEQGKLSKGRSLKVSLADYDEPSANRGHEPRARASQGRGRGAGPRGRRKS
ncbi:hypothetical protein LINGRAPRIM_LOCUS331 [Linum grandiflorum]